MTNALDALKGLTANAPIQLAQLQRQRADEMRRNLELAASSHGRFATGATPGDVTDLEQDIAQAPGTGIEAQKEVADTEALNRGITSYNRPDVTEMRHEQAHDALARVLAPIQMKGQYEVEAAKQRAESQATRDQALMGGRENIANITTGAKSEQVTNTLQQTQLRQRLHDLQIAKAKASGSGLGNLFGLAGPSEAGKIDAEMAQIQQQMAGGAPAAPDGWEYVSKPGGGWTAVPK
jgi:hypothetical protein